MPAFISIPGLLLLVFLASVAEKNLNPGTGLYKIISVITAVLPSVLWITVFYSQDRRNPEPKSFVFKTLILGALVQKAVYAPVISLIFPKGNTSYLALDYISTVIMTAVIQEAVKLLAIRYSIYSGGRFDEKIDGVVYGSALGLGFAAMTSLDSILATGGAMLSNAASMAVIEAFAHASITGLSCYFLSVSKYKKFSAFRLTAGLLAASALNALTQFLLNSVTRVGFNVNYYLGLIPAGILAVLIFGILIKISSTDEKDASLTKPAAPTPRKEFLAVLPVWVVLLITVTAGYFLSNTLKMKTCSIDDVLELHYPSHWMQVTQDEDLFKAADMINGDKLRFVSVKRVPLDKLMNLNTASEEEMLHNTADAWTIKSGMNYRFYQPVKGYFLDSKGTGTYILEYIYINSNHSKTGEMSVPAIGYGRDVISILDGQVYILTISTNYDDSIQGKGILNEVSYKYD